MPRPRTVDPEAARSFRALCYDLNKERKAGRISLEQHAERIRQAYERCHGKPLPPIPKRQPPE